MAVICKMSHSVVEEASFQQTPELEYICIFFIMQYAQQYSVLQCRNTDR